MRSFALAVLFALLLAAPARAVPSAPGRIEFEVLRNGQPFGRHVVTVSEQGGGFTVRTEVALRVDAGPLTLFRYEQNCDETWRAGALANLNCSTLKAGRRTQVRAETAGDMLRVTGARGVSEFPVGVWPTSWWTKPPTGATALLNTETGAHTPMRVIRMGEETIEAGGVRIRAEHVRVEGTLAADLWYDSSGRWVGCAFTAHGQRVTYRLASPRNAGPA